jgi:hypothetical protein
MEKIAGAAALLCGLLLAAGCGKKAPAPQEEDTPQYREWKGGQILRQVPSAGGAPAVPGRLRILPPEDRVRRGGDFCEVYLNAEILVRFRTGRLPDGRWPEWDGPVRLRAGPNWIDLWDSTTNRHYRHAIDTREGTDLLFTPTADGYDLRQEKTE